MPGICVALFWAIASIASAVVLVYFVVVERTHRHIKFEEGGLLAKLNSKWTLWFIAAFAVSAIFVAGLVLEAPKWGIVEWAIVVVAVPLYKLSDVFVQKWIGRNYTKPFRAAGSAWWNWAILGSLLCAIYAIVLIIAHPSIAYPDAYDAFMAADRPFDQSPSALMVMVDRFSAYASGLTAYGMGQAAQVLYALYLVFRILLCASAFFGIANLLNLCALQLSEIKKVFLPLSINEGDSPTFLPLKRYVVLSGILPAILVIIFVTVDVKTASVVQTDECTAVDAFIRNRIGVATVVVDNTKYDYEEVQNLISHFKQRAEGLSEEAGSAVEPLINEAFDRRVANVDSYLDWYYSLPADYERLGKMVTGSAEQYVADQLSAKIEDGVDNAALEEKIGYYSGQAEMLKSDAFQKLEECSLENVPEWLVVVKETMEASVFDEMLEPTGKLLDAPERFGVSVAAGFGTGVVAKAVTNKVLGTQFAKKAVSKIAGFLSAKGAGAAVGGTLGSIAGPAGTVAGTAVGVAAGVGVDYALLCADEMQNRENYKQEIVAAIEGQREEMLDIF